MRLPPILTRMKKYTKPVDYKVKYIGREDFEIKFTLEASDKMFDLILQKGLDALKNKGHIPKDTTGTEIQEFQIDKENPKLRMYLKTIKPNINKQVKYIFKDCLSIDNMILGIGPDVYTIEKIVYTKSDKIWYIKIYIEGNCFPKD